MRLTSLLVLLPAICLASIAFAAEAPSEPPLTHTVSWLGNTFAEPDKWVQMDAAAMFVAPDGTVYLNVFWEEGGRNVGIYKDGQCIGNAGHTHGWGYEGGEAVTANDKYLFIAQHVGNEGGGLKSPNSWPPKGKGWTGISRRLRDGKPAPFDGGKGGDGDTLKGCFLPVNEFDEKAAVPITGLAASNDKLYVADASGKIKIFDPNTMVKTGEFDAPRAKQIALTSDGSLWALQVGVGSGPSLPPAPQVGHYSTKGEPLPQTILGAVVPRALASDAKGHILVADDWLDQQVKVFDPVSCKQVGTLGVKHGIFSGVKGQVGPGRLNGLVGVGSDAAGNIYVACKGRSDGNGSGLVLQSYKPDGTLNWELLGLEFVDNADVDPAADTNVYTKEEHFAMDYSKPRGQEWSYKGYTLDRFAYPNDPRLHVEFASTFARRIAGKLFLFGIDMYSDHLLLYRMTDKDEIAIPCGYFAQRHHKGDWPPSQPAKGEWIWLDANGNGDFDAAEYDSQPSDNPQCWGWWVDSKGDVWQAGDANKIRRFPCQGLSDQGVPKYSFATAKTEPAPEPFTNLQRIEYFPATDTMYLSGYSRDFPNKKGNWKTIGKVVCRYDDWSTKKTKRWELNPPFDEAQEGSKTFGTPVAMSVAGDYLFITLLKTAEVRVYETATAKFCGTLRPGKDMSGWVDIPYAVRAHKRADGEYLVFVEEDWKSKIIMYRWKP
ncbi:MAG TPA: hypothetical protein VGP72_22390 [Planctomycetota bacterium]|jgi:hypothetical protein